MALCSSNGRHWINTKSSSRQARPENPAHRCSRLLPAKTAASHKRSRSTSADTDEKDARDPDLRHIPILNRQGQFLSQNALKLYAVIRFVCRLDLKA